MVKGSRHKARRAAVQALYQWQLTQQAPGEIENHFILDHEMDDIDVDYFHHLVREIPLHIHELDDHITPHLDRRVNDVDPVELACLRIGTYEFEFHPEIPYKVILNEAVELAKTFGAEHGHKYVNAILDKVAEGLRASEIRTARSMA
ncbi:MAG TPA: transcription antitermination factor NusB [Candidatus Methylomirabilis sp.]|nr:transcription antitermination factor NusB [Candidatus Methylomirabilis sp.]